MSNLQAILHYAEMGYSVLPCTPNGKKPVTEHGLKDASTDPEQIRRWFDVPIPPNPAIRTDEIVVVDVDEPNNPFLSHTPQDRLSDLGQAPMQHTPRGGFHFVFRQNGKPLRNTQGKIATKVDTRANGGYIMVYPSVVDGKQYKWGRALTPRQNLPVVPEWIEEASEPTAKKQKSSAVERARAYIEKMPDAISGHGGHDATFAASCECFRFGLTDADAIGIMRSFNANKTGGEPWTDAELKHKLDDARETVIAAGQFGARVKEQPGKAKKKQKQGAGNTISAQEVLQDLRQIANAVAVGEGQINYLTIAEILKHIDKKTDGWPRRVGQDLFIHDLQHGISFLPRVSSVFGWLAHKVGAVRWYKGAAAVNQAEVFAELQRTAQAYHAVEELPHEPPMQGHYYACEAIPPGDGQALNWLIDRFCPATDYDRYLIVSAFLTPLWGGPCGCRPCYVITSDDGRGSGKTTLAESVGAVFGGILQFSHLEDIGTIKTRLLSPDAQTKRVCLLDNVKSHKFSWGELEGMITASTIGGRRLYCGEASRPNGLTWFITLNGAALSTDMAQRSVIIKIRKPERSATWAEETRLFIETHRLAIIGDLIAALRGPQTPLATFSRWASWEKDILQRLPGPDELQQAILERQAVVDVDKEESTLIEDFFADQLARLGYRPDTERVFIPSQVAGRWFGWATNQKVTVVSASRQLNQAIGEKSLPRLELPGRSWGRGFCWVGERWNLTHTATDLLERIRDKTTPPMESSTNEF